MEKIDLERLQEWFAGYCRGFFTESTEDNRNFALKEQHSRLVCDNMNLLTGTLALGKSERLTAEAIALFHDVGRFEQYRRYSTFKDSISVNHAALGVRVLVEERVLETIPEDERRTIFRAVTFHNVYQIPDAMDTRDLLFTRLIRDADKLDIWRVFIDYYGLPEEERASAVGLGFPDLPQCSPEVLKCLRQREIVQLAAVQTLNDFRLLQLSWVFDLNFPESFRLVRERGCIDALAAVLPTDAKVGRAVEAVRDFVEAKVQG